MVGLRYNAIVYFHYFIFVTLLTRNKVSKVKSETMRIRTLDICIMSKTIIITGLAC